MQNSPDNPWEGLRPDFFTSGVRCGSHHHLHGRGLIDLLDRELNLTEDRPKADHQSKPRPISLLIVLMFVTKIMPQPILDSSSGNDMRDQGYYSRRPWEKLCITRVPAALRTSAHVNPQFQNREHLLALDSAESSGLATICYCSGKFLKASPRPKLMVSAVEMSNPAEKKTLQGGTGFPPSCRTD